MSESQKPINLFEYGKLKKLPENFNKEYFKNFLDEVWQKHKEEIPPHWSENEDKLDADICKKQKFLFFDDKKVKSKNFVGYIKFDGVEFNLYPKICTEDNATDTLLWWLQYGNDCKFPNFQVNLDSCDCENFFEIIIRLFAKYTADVFSTSLFCHYEKVSTETAFLKGKLNFNNYLKNMAFGKAYKFHCTYDSFEFNNKFNQIVKYVSKMLYPVSKNSKNKRLLNEIVYTLNDVDDITCCRSDCEQVYINHFLSEFVTILDYCKLFLQNCVSFNESGNFESFAFLLRTEKLFEDFLINFMEENCKKDEISIRVQNKYSLGKHDEYTLQPDIVIYKNNNPYCIIDIKYKKLEDKPVQSDFYQMLAYSHRLKCESVHLLYPACKKSEFNPIEINEYPVKIQAHTLDCCINNKNKKEAFEAIKDKLEKVLNQM